MAAARSWLIGGCGAALLLAAACRAPTAEEIHASAPVVDGHNDLPWELREKFGGDLAKVDLAQVQPQLHTDLVRLRQGGVGAQFWSAWVAYDADQSTLKTFLEQIDLIHRLVARYPDDLELARSAADVERIRSAGRIACLIGVEGGHALDDSLAVLRLFHELGVRYLTLTHTETISWADSATDAAKHGGLTPFGEEVVREMNRLGMLVDLSHVSVETMQDALRVTRAPVIASHSSSFALVPHPRNIPDDVLREIGRNGGVVLVNFYPGFVVRSSASTALADIEERRRLKAQLGAGETLDRAMEQWHADHPLDRGSVRDVVDHIVHIAAVAGVDHVGLGSDFDGIPTTPVGLEDVSKFPAITKDLLERGWNEADIRKVLGGNVLRVLAEAERLAGGDDTARTVVERAGGVDLVG